MKLCKNCKYHKEASVHVAAACANSEVNDPDFVTGDPPQFIYQMTTCQAARAVGRCGAEAKFYEEKPEN